MRGPGPAAPRRAREASGGWAGKERGLRTVRAIQGPLSGPLRGRVDGGSGEREGGPDQELGEP